MRTIVDILVLVVVIVLLFGALAPRDMWRDGIVGSKIWGAEDDSDLAHMRPVLGVTAFVIMGWLLYARRENWSDRFLSSHVRRQLANLLLLVLVMGSALMVARFLIVFHDHVRSVGPKTPYSEWGQFLGRIWTVPYQDFNDRDFFTSLFMSCAGFMALTMYMFRKEGLPRAHDRAFPARLWALIAFGCIWAGVDELASLHEFLGPNLPLVKSTTITKYPDDLIVLSYALGGLIVLGTHFRYLTANRIAFLVAMVGGAFQFSAAANVFPGMALNEEALELYGALCYFGAVFWYVYGEIRESLSLLNSSMNKR
jgi:hypothetical protein